MFTVTVPQNASTEALSILVGCHTDTLWDKEAIERFPDIVRTYPVESTETAVVSAFGGLIYLRIPEETNLGPIEVTFDGVVRAPLTAVIIISETTGSRGFMLPLLGAALVADGAAQRVCKERLYHGLSRNFLDRAKAAPPG